jgi:hypothetical protein
VKVYEIIVTNSLLLKPLRTYRGLLAQLATFLAISNKRFFIVFNRIFKTGWSVKEYFSLQDIVEITVYMRDAGTAYHPTISMLLGNGDRYQVNLMRIKKATSSCVNIINEIIEILNISNESLSVTIKDDYTEFFNLDKAGDVV